jgi:hypothetical protein
MKQYYICSKRLTQDTKFKSCDNPGFPGRTATLIQLDD